MRSLKLIRKQKGFTQDDLARETDMTARKIGALERGEVELNMRDAEIIAAALGVTVGYLAGDDEGTVDQASTDERLEKIMLNYLSMNETGRSRLAEQAMMMAGSGMFVDR